MLIILGVYGVVGLALTERGEHRVGLGTGVVTVVALGVIKGVIMAVQRQR